MNEFGQLRPVTLNDRAFFQDVCAERDSRSCECAFANLYLWQKPYREEFTVIDGRIVVIERATEIMHFPMGAYFPAEQLAAIFDGANRAGIPVKAIYDVPEDYPDASAFFDEDSDEDAFDYLYELDHLAEMAGPLLRKKRNLVHQFERLYPDYRIVPVTTDNLDETLALATQLNQRLRHVDFLDEEEIAMDQVHRNFAALGMGGLLLFAGEREAGFSLFSKINSDTWDIHFEKADHEVKGAPQMLTIALARHLLTLGGRYMNREQDMGEPGLRQAKRSLAPCCMLKRRYFTRKIKA